MSETAKVRFVRCPKCEKLLPEVTEYSVYQCGGCLAVLRAKNKGVDLDTISQKSGEENVGGTVEKLSDRCEKEMNVSEKGEMDMSDGSENDVRSNISSLSRAERRRMLHDRPEGSRNGLTNKEEKWDDEANDSESDVRSNISSSSPADRRRMLRESGESNRNVLANKEEKWDGEANGSESDMRSNISYSRRAERRRMLSEGGENNRNGSISKEKKWDVETDGFESDVRSNISSSSRAERRILRDRAGNYRTGMAKEGHWDAEDDVILGKRSDELRRAKIAQDFENLAIYNENGNRLRGRVAGSRNGEKSEMDSFLRGQRMNVQVANYMNDGPSGLVSKSIYAPDYTKEGPSNLVTRSSYAYENVDYVRGEQVELLKKLDELKDQLSRSGNLIDKGKEKVPLDRRIAHQDPYASANFYPEPSPKVNVSQFQRYGEPPPIMHRQETGSNGFYHPRNAPTRVQGYTDPLTSQGLRRGHYQNPSLHHMSRSHAYMSGPYMDGAMVYMDTMEPYPPNLTRHHTSCVCYQCLNNRQVVHSNVLPNPYSDKYSDIPNKMFNYHDTAGSSFGSRDYDNHRMSNPPPPLRSHTAQSHTRWPSDVNSEVDGFTRRPHPTRIHLASGGQHCRPIAGGAPFLTCHNCFELLLLPKKVVAKNDNIKKVKCGACSMVISFLFSNKNLVFSSPTDVKANDTPINANNKHEAHLTHARTTFSSYDSSGSDRRCMERANSSNDTRNRHSTSTHASEAEDERGNSSGPRKDSSFADVARNDKGPSPQAGLTLQEYFEYSNQFHLAKRKGKENKNVSSDNEQLQKKNFIPEIRRKESSATEIDISSNEYGNTGSTFDSGECSKEGDNLKGRGAARSYFAGIMKKASFVDSDRSSDTFEQEKANVTVNGHLMPERLLKKAEKLAGPVYPGNYWYDFRAGFWGAMGGPCLGIIPPFIEQFNYPMPYHCAGGNTHVYVNGRELNQKDLNLLGSRGLPTERDRSYIIEISGRVLDEDTGEELGSLGRLAPTVEKAKRGFGMRDPNVVAAA